MAARAIVVRRIDRTEAGNVVLVLGDSNTIDLGTVDDVQARVAGFLEQADTHLVSLFLSRWAAVDPTFANDNLVEGRTVQFDDSTTNLVRFV